MTPKIQNQRHATVAVAKLTPHPRNPRRGNVQAIQESIQANGFFGTIVVQASTGFVIVGNHRLQAARSAGMAKVPVVYVDVDDATALRILLADNRTGELATNDLDRLGELLAELAADDDLAGTGYDPTYLEQLLRATETSQAPAVAPADAWQGMPAFEADDKTPHATVTVHFANEEDAERFFALIGVPRARYVYWPAGDGHVGSSLSEQYVSDPEA